MSSEDDDESSSPPPPLVRRLRVRRADDLKFLPIRSILLPPPLCFLSWSESMSLPPLWQLLAWCLFLPDDRESAPVDMPRARWKVLGSMRDFFSFFLDALSAWRDDADDSRLGRRRSRRCCLFRSTLMIVAQFLQTLCRSVQSYSSK